MKKYIYGLSLFALLAGAGLGAVHWRGGHGHHHGGWGHHGWRGWGGPRFGFGISVGGPRYYAPAPVAFIDDPYEYYYSTYGNPFSDLIAYRQWLRDNSHRFRVGGWRHWWGLRDDYRARPRFHIGVGF